MSITEDKLNTLLSDLSFDANGLIPAIAQQFDSGEVLMMAWMNKEAIKATLMENRGIYWEGEGINEIGRRSDTGEVVIKIDNSVICQAQFRCKKE